MLRFAWGFRIQGSVRIRPKRVPSIWEILVQTVRKIAQRMETLV